MKYLSELKFHLTGGRVALMSVAIAAVGIISTGMSPKQYEYCKIFSFGLCLVSKGVDKGIHF